MTGSTHPVGALYVVDADGSDLRNIGNGFYASWSPDSSRIAVATPHGSDTVVYTTALDGSDVRVLVRKRGDGVLEAVAPEDWRSRGDAASCIGGVVVPNPQANPGLVRDCEALFGLRDRLNDHSVLNWDTNTPIAGWKGVTFEGPPDMQEDTDSQASPPPRVRGLSLPQRNLSSLRGIIPAVANLTELWRLDLSGNRLTESISSDVASLTSLRVLNLGSNHMSGPIPSELGDLTSLRVLNLGSNRLSGPIPAELGDLPALEELHLSFTALSGSIPPAMGNLTSLRVLNLRDAGVSGTIPADLGKLAALEVLNLSFNDLSGTIPPELGRLAALELLNLSFNDLSGTIPAELGRLTALEYLDVGSTKIAGCIPPELRGKVRGYGEPEDCT